MLLLRVMNTDLPQTATKLYGNLPVLQRHIDFLLYFPDVDILDITG